jgi:glycosyltransferase involved in cell wall biosynthesis
VAVVDSLVGGGGGERVAAQMVERLDPARFDRTFCVTRPSAAALLDELRAAGVRVLELDRGAQFDLRSWQPLIRLLRDERVHVLHSHKFGSNVWCALIARRVRVPVFVTHEHSWSFTDDRLRVALDRRLIASRADAMVAVSSADARRMIAVEQIPERKIRIIPNGILRPAFADPAVLRTELGLAPDLPIIGMVASLRPEKRVDLLLDAVQVVASSGRPFHVVIVGAGPLADELSAHAENIGVADRVSFLGYRPNGSELAAAFDIAVLASDREGTPLSLLEYMALGRAIVATAVGGIPEAIADERDGLLVEPGAAAQLAAAITRLLDAPEERLRLGSAAARRQAAEYDLDGTVHRIESLYVELLGDRAPAGL